MIRGIGLDLCDSERMKRLSESRRFCEKVFTEEELEYAFKRSEPALHLAGAFAAKEAFAKASGLGLGAVGLKNVSLSHDSEGRPFLRLNPDADALKAFQKTPVHLSLSHDRGIAAAVVICETFSLCAEQRA